MSYPVPYRSAVPTAYARPPVSDGHVAFAWVAAVLTLGYMLPWAIAATRRKSNAALIGLVNFLAGWTAIGWIVTLVMACLEDPVTLVAPVQLGVLQPMQAPPGWYPDANGIRHYWNGAAWTA
jgi:hypothetical protein